MEPDLTTGPWEQLAAVYKALGDENRLAILEMLRRRELCVCDILAALPLAQPTVSHHLKILRQAGLITHRKAGKWVFYALAPGTLATATSHLSLLAVQGSKTPGIFSGSRPQHCRDD